ncbi:MAG: hypothetical protein PHE17_19875 [Thiothrix sp.]|uniref:hypothetical protein n=1 Tax=Thiothrix sp. TaxID=1032 RepID=UPI0026250DD6|nr:hypothetical protein [Thiothrix sp.]MDD5395288.1 hypothetical protein [Thiothrix sp.]
MENESTGLGSLLEMLTYARPAGSASEQEFINRYIRPLGVIEDAFGNLMKEVSHPDVTNPVRVLWSCHTDTVHNTEGRQSVYADRQGYAGLSKKSKSSCLGADDTAGVWLMIQMIKREVPGLYIFHRSEEIGGLGSSYIAEKTPELLQGILAAIALDRKGTTSVITHQGARCCSDAFADSLCDELNLTKSLGDDWVKDAGGLFTDTANYTGLIGECTNLSVGYYQAHTKDEYLDFRHLQDMLESLCELDQTALVFQREAGATDPDDFDYRTYDRKWTDYYGAWDNLEPKGEGLVDLVIEHPDAVADLLEQTGITREDLLAYVGRRF